MVVKQVLCIISYFHMFENGVILYGSKTTGLVTAVGGVFENGVILYGSKTHLALKRRGLKFENGVILYGSKTDK